MTPEFIKELMRKNGNYPLKQGKKETNRDFKVRQVKTESMIDALSFNCKAYEWAYQNLSESVKDHGAKSKQHLFWSHVEGLINAQGIRLREILKIRVIARGIDEINKD